jgi:hypothetical protein
LSNTNFNGVINDIGNFNEGNNSAKNVNISLVNINKMVNVGNKNSSSGLKKSNNLTKVGNKLRIIAPTSLSSSS